MPVGATLDVEEEGQVWVLENFDGGGGGAGGAVFGGFEIGGDQVIGNEVAFELCATDIIEDVSVDFDAGTGFAAEDAGYFAILGNTTIRAKACVGEIVFVQDGLDIVGPAALRAGAQSYSHGVQG